MDFNTFIFIAIASAFGVVAMIVWVVDSGVSDKYKSLLMFVVLGLTAALGGMFFMIEDDSQFEYAGYQKMKRGKGGGQKQSAMEEGAAEDKADTVQQQANGGESTEVIDETTGPEEADPDDPTTTITLKDADKGPQKDCEKCPEMVAIKPGTALLGSTHLILSGNMKSGPAAQKDFHKTFYIGKYEITVEEFQSFTNEMNYKPQDNCRRLDGENGAKTFLDPGFTQTPKDPVVCVSWKDASKYALWLSAKTGKSYRLPTEAEWEFAARAGTTQTFMTGDTISPRVANYRPFSGKWTKKTSPVGSYKANANGMYDVHGNAWEFVNDCWSRYYQVADASAGGTKTPKDCTRRIVKGGSWSSPLKQTGFPMRGAIPMDLALDGVGFRVMHE